MEWQGKRLWIASEAQLARCHQLTHMALNGRISGLRFEVPIDLIVNNLKICTYRVDAIYDEIEPEHGRTLRTVYEEVKGYVTDDYAIKRALFEALMGVGLSVIQIDGSRPEFDEDGKRKRDDQGKPISTRAQWMWEVWADRLPD